MKGGKLNHPNFNAYIMSILLKKGRWLDPLVPNYRRDALNVLRYSKL